MLQSGQRRGFLIALEGIDGAGKTTQANLLGKKLNEDGFDAIVLKEPTVGEWGRKISMMSKFGRTLSAEDEFKYFYEDRKEDVEKNIDPALRSGKIVIMDRYYYSNMAYQGAKGLDPTFIENKNLEIAPEPDLVIILDIDATTAKDRIVNGRKDQPNHFEHRLSPVRKIFLDIAHERQNVEVLDGNQPAEKIHSWIFQLVSGKVGQANERQIIRYNRRSATQALI
ncbi:MAG: dTMP kinase [Nitrososphaerales archaeon]